MSLKRVLFCWQGELAVKPQLRSCNWSRQHQHTCPKNLLLLTLSVLFTLSFAQGYLPSAWKSRNITTQHERERESVRVRERHRRFLDRLGNTMLSCAVYPPLPNSYILYHSSLYVWEALEIQFHFSFINFHLRMLSDCSVIFYWCICFDVRRHAKLPCFPIVAGHSPAFFFLVYWFQYPLACKISAFYVTLVDTDLSCQLVSQWVIGWKELYFYTNKCVSPPELQNHKT